MNKNNRIFVIISETVLTSIVKDIFTFLMFAGLLYFNHKILSGATVIDLLFIAIVIILLATKNSKRCFEGTREEAIKFLSESEE